MTTEQDKETWGHDTNLMPLTGDMNNAQNHIKSH